MKKGVLKITACCLAGSMAFAGNGVISMAAGLDTPLAGLESRIQEKKASDTVQVKASGYDAKAIAQVSEYVNIRDAASEQGAIVGQLYNNSAADILAQEGDWYLIKSGDVTGYVKAEFFVTGEKAKKLASEIANEVATVNTTTLMVRSKPNEKSDVISMVGDSESLQVLADEGDWVKVAVDADVEGYVSKDYVECKTEFVEAESIEKVEERASAVKAATEKAEKMLDAAVEAMNSATADEAEYAAYMASLAAADAKALAAEQSYDYDLQELADSAVSKANEAAYAAIMADQAEAAAAAEAQAKADAEAAKSAEAAAAADAQAKAEQAAKDAAAAQEQANQQWSENAQAEADAAAQQAADAAAQAAAAKAAADQAAADQAAADQAAADQAAANQGSSDQGSSDQGSSDQGSSDQSSSSSTSDSTSTSGTRQSVVNFALQFVGNPYVWGGTSLTNGADCSGFTQSVLANFGIGIPRTAGAQSVSGTPVDLGSIQPGDLLFYSGSGDYGIGHVSMYIGNGQVVHASNSTTGIIISDIGYRTPTCARSYIG